MPIALLSVSDKTDIVELARGLVSRGFKLVSTGGTARAATSSCKSRVALRVSGWSGADQEGDLVQKGLQQFQKLNPCISTFYSPVPGDYPSKLQAQFASSEPPFNHA